jgi:NADH-quinone oxidoreductase subunit B
MKSREDLVSPRGGHWEKNPSPSWIGASFKSQSLFSMLKSWSRSDVLVPFVLGSSCCAREIERLSGPNPQGTLVREEFFSQPVEDCDVLFVSGIINAAVKPYMLEKYEAMMKPRYVVAIGACAASGAVFDTIAADELFPVDVYVPGCPPTIESLVQAIELLRHRVRKGASKEVMLQEPKA